MCLVTDNWYELSWRNCLWAQRRREIQMDLRDPFQHYDSTASFNLCSAFNEFKAMTAFFSLCNCLAKGHHHQNFFLIQAREFLFGLSWDFFCHQTTKIRTRAYFLEEQKFRVHSLTLRAGDEGKGSFRPEDHQPQQNYSVSGCSLP